MKPQKQKPIILTLAWLAFFAGNLTAAPVGTAFTYQGRLSDGPNPASGTYDLKFTLYDDPSAGSVVGTSLTNAATGVTNGLCRMCCLMPSRISPMFWSM